MKQFKLLLKASLLLCLIGFLPSCEDDDNGPIEVKTLKGEFIVNEGSMGLNNGSITFINSETSESTQNFFEQVNGRQLGDIVQSFTISNEKGFIVVNNSQKIEVVDMTTFKSLDVIPELSYPRMAYVASDNNLYVTNGKGSDPQDEVLVIDTKIFEISKRIKVGKGPEKMVEANGKLYVANSGGYELDHTISVIDLATQEVIKTIDVKYQPTDLLKDKNGKIWVLCKGGLDKNNHYQPVTNAFLHQINPETDEVKKALDFGGQLKTYGSYLLAINKEKDALYFANGAVYKMSIDATTLPTDPFIEVEGLYGLDVNPANGHITVTTTDYKTSGEAIEYDETGNKVATYNTGLNPNAVVFNN